EWADDWTGGVWMKAVISQTIFANVATLPTGALADTITPKLRVNAPGEYPLDESPVADHDSNGWPQTPRNTALRAMRKAMAFHIAGDQHLGSTIQYGIDEWGEAGWAICVPSVANVWPRRWFPPKPGRNHEEGKPPYTGEYLDGFGNRITVHAVSNPAAVGVEPTAINHRAPGYGIVSFNRASRKITLANWPRWVDATQPDAKPYEGWPITIDQLDNGYPPGGRSLGEVTSETENPVVQVIDQKTGKIAYTLRINGKSFKPMVRSRGIYTVKIWESDEAEARVIKDLEPQWDPLSFRNLNRDGFPLNINPKYVTPSKAPIGDDDMVMGVIINAQARAYPVNYMNGPRNEVVNDRLGGRAITSSW
ncbi:MAG: DUF3179 domain-containing protein, partial [bacterium]|nr:DUF3179 domain-containing protein [bacterium]